MDNEEFDVQEQQSSGQMNVRTFRAVYTPALTQDSAALNNSVALANSQMKSPTKSTSVNVLNTQQNSSSNNGAKVKLSNNLNTTLANKNISDVTSNVIGLVAAGYDPLGARLYRLTKTGVSINPLKSNTSYKFVITARLEEKINNSWQTVKNPVNQLPIVQIKQMYFKTNSETVGTATTSGQTIQTAVKL